jgi:hypothetical protein
MVETLVGIAVALLVLLLGFLFYLSSQQHRKQRARYAERKGYRYLDNIDYGMHENYPGFRVFQKGFNRFGHNFLTFEEHGMLHVMLDFNYQQHTMENRTSLHTLSAIIVETGFPLRELTIRPESILDKIAGFFKGEDIQLDDPEFNRRFLVSSPDPGWATEFLDPEMMEYLLKAPRCVIEISNGNIIVYTGKRFDDGDFDRYLQHLNQVIELIPQRLRKAGETVKPK